MELLDQKETRGIYHFLTEPKTLDKASREGLNCQKEKKKNEDGTERNEA